jgi:hypothetical protein
MSLRLGEVVKAAKFQPQNKKRMRCYGYIVGGRREEEKEEEEEAATAKN